MIEFACEKTLGSQITQKTSAMHVGHIMGKRDGIVVTALVSHLCGPGSGHEWVKLVVDSLLCSEGFPPGSLVFPSPQKSTFPNSNSIGYRTSLKTTFR